MLWWTVKRLRNCYLWWWWWVHDILLSQVVVFRLCRHHNISTVVAALVTLMHLRHSYTDILTMFNTPHLPSGYVQRSSPHRDITATHAPLTCLPLHPTMSVVDMPVRCQHQHIVSLIHCRRRWQYHNSCLMHRCLLKKLCWMWVALNFLVN